MNDSLAKALVEELRGIRAALEALAHPLQTVTLNAQPAGTQSVINLPQLSLITPPAESQTEDSPDLVAATQEAPSRKTKWKSPN